MIPASFLVLSVFAAPVRVEPDVEVEDDITELSLEELMNIEVSVASRSQQSIADAPAAVYVLTGDELRRSGHSSIQEALRMVPGFLVGHWQSVTWDATSRGFTSAFNHNILVLIDGVNVYTMMGTEGVRWHLQEIDLADVERIEVIRGPGAALWGQNAVNGVINVVTKSSAQTQGLAVRAIVGGELEKTALRYGGALDDSGSTYRVWGVGSLHDGLATAGGHELDHENWWIGRVGARADIPLASGGTLALFANAFEAGREHNYQIDYQYQPSVAVHTTTPERGQTLATHWEVPHANGDLDRVTSSFQHVVQDRKDYDTRVDIFDVDWMRRQALASWNTLSYGLGWRFVGWEFDGDFSYNHAPEASTNWSVRAFAFDESAFADGAVRVVLGAEVENNDLTGTEVQPTLRTLWAIEESTTLWAAASRAVRTPSLLESYDYSQYALAPDDLLLWHGNEDLDSEEVLAYELGLRWRPHERVSVDAVVFYNDLDNVVTNEDGTPFTVGATNYTPFTYGNLGSAEAWGFELAIDTVLTDDWRVRSAVTHFEQNNFLDPSSTDTSFLLNDDLFPENIANLRSYCDLGSDWELDLGLYFVDPIREYATPSYVRSDARLGYAPNADWRFSIGVQNANDPYHPEDGGAYVERNVWFGFAWSK
ncbi:MAG: TonB-dependent receptor [Planctomycetes bacterium]|nr:TonB-dependent receptor [Planctomycetota bacterium]